MTIYLSLGSNLGNRRRNLGDALRQLEINSVSIQRVSPVVESPAMLPQDAPSEWNRPFLNLVAACQTSLRADALLCRIKRIEQELGRTDERRWSPRPIDIDILTYDDAIVRTEELTIPHPGLTGRTFMLTPLVALDPGFVVPGAGVPALELDRRLGLRIPLWMGIINLTPDSFSDGGELDSWHAVEQRLDSMLGAGVHILDLGAESTRPGANLLSADQEWSRLEPNLERTIEKLAGEPLRPLLSIDTYHPEVAQRGIERGIDFINDVSGLTNDAMIDVVADADCQIIAMHNLGIPADPKNTLDANESAVDQVEVWLDRQIGYWTGRGLDSSRIVFDPGIGFGKTPLQSLEILQQIDRFRDKGVRVLVGHSRKSFMNAFAYSGTTERDLVTIGSSMALCERAVDIIRVHNVPDHVTAYRGWAHMQRPDVA